MALEPMALGPTTAVTASAATTASDLRTERRVFCLVDT
jgi:hypothetical protein